MLYFNLDSEMGDDKTTTIVKALTLLTSPNTSTQQPIGQNEMMLEALIRNVEKVEEYLGTKDFKLDFYSFTFEDVELNEENSIKRNLNKFLNTCQKLLIALKHSLVDEVVNLSVTSDTPKGILSIQQKKIVTTCVQLIVSLGLIPNFICGIGIPIAKRSNYSNFIQSISTSSFSEENYLTLNQIMRSLLICNEHKEFKDIIQCHTSDILASLLQLTHIPIKTLLSVESESVEAQKQRFLNIKREMALKLKNFLSELQSPIVIKEILVLIGCNSVATPNWFRKICNNYLSKELIRPLGLQNVISAILCNELSENKEGIYDWQKCEVVSKIVVGSRLPNQSADDYFGMVLPQALEILRVETKHQQLYIMVSANIFIKSTELHGDFAQKFLWSPLLQPLMICSEQNAINLGDQGVNEEDLSKCINDLFKLFVLGTNIPELMYGQLTRVIDILFHLYKFCKSTISNLKGNLQSLLIAYLQHNSENAKINFFRKVLFGIDDPDCNTLSLNDKFEFGIGSNGGLCFSLKTENEETDWMKEIDSTCNAVLSLIDLLQKDNFISTFFLMLLQEFTEMQQKLDEIKNDKLSSSNTKLLLEIEENITNQQIVIKNLFLIIYLFELMTEDLQLQTQMTSDKIASFKLLKMMFARSVGKKIHDESFETETITIAVTLTLILASNKLTPQENLYLKSMIPDLKHISEHHHNDKIRKMTEELSYSILNDGKSKPSDQKTTKKPLTKFQTLMEELEEPLVPVRGHALIGLRNLLLKRDTETISHADDLFVIFQKNLNDEDSYIYLAAIQGLAALTDRYADKSVPLLTSEFANFDNSKERNSVELRLKLGEVLLKVTQMLGDIMPKYRDLFLQAFLSGCKDDDVHVRASSLSNLGEVCKGLKFSIGPWIHEILLCITSLLKTDNSPEVKEACLLVITLLFRGLGENIFQVLETVIHELFRLLKTVYSIEKDEKIKLHAQLALEELNIATKKFINPEQKLEKKIYILNPPN